MPFPIGKSAVEAWSQDDSDAASGRDGPAEELDRPGGGATDVPDGTAGLAVRSSTPPQAGDYAGGLDERRTNLVAILVGMLAVLLILRWHLSVRGRQHYPRS